MPQTTRLVRPLRAALLIAALVAAPLTAAAQRQGVDDRTIRLAQVAAMEGPARALGQGMALGLRAAFAEANAAGGVHGRRVVLDSIDDGYEPNRSVTAVRRVIDADRHLALVGPVGTPTTQATQPMATAAGMPMIGPYTGAGFLRDPALANVLNVRATYAAEIEAWMRHLVDERGLRRIALLHQDDGFGHVGRMAATAALARRGMTLIAQGAYARNTTAVKSALLDIREGRPEAVVMVGTAAPIAEFVRLSERVRMAPVFVTISFVGTAALAADLGADGAGVIVSQVVPSPFDPSLPLAARYHAALEAVAPGADPDYVSFEGYVAGRVALRALTRAGPDLDRGALLEAMADLGAFDLDGLPFAYGPGDNQGLDAVFLTRLDGRGGATPLRPASAAVRP